MEAIRKVDVAHIILQSDTFCVSFGIFPKVTSGLAAFCYPL